MREKVGGRMDDVPPLKFKEYIYKSAQRRSTVGQRRDTTTRN